MTLALLFLLGGWLLGVCVVRRLLRTMLDSAECIFWGVVIGWMLTTTGMYAIARWEGRVTISGVVAATVAIWLIIILLSASPLRHLVRSSPTVNSVAHLISQRLRSSLGLVIILIGFAPVFVRLYWTHMLQPGSDGLYSRGSTFYDLGFHLAISNSFLYGQNLPPVYTPFPPAPLFYPYLPDFQLAVLGAAGMNMRTALLVTSVILALTVTGIFYTFARRVVTFIGGSSIESSDLTAAIATILFLLNGGLGFCYFFTDWRASGKSLITFWSQLNINYAHMAERNFEWANFISDALLPQRTSLFGFAVAFIVFTLFAQAWKRWSNPAADGSSHTSRLLAIAGVLTGLLPLFHSHSYIGLGLISGFLFLLRPRRQWLAFWVPAVLLAVPYLIGISKHVSSDGFIRFQPGWRGPVGWTWILYWMRNIGVPALLIIPGWLAAPSEWRRFYLGFVALLIFSLIVIVSPNDFDNIKLIYLWYAPTSVLIAAWLVRLARIQRQRLIAVILLLLCVASGGLALQYENAGHELMYTYEEESAAIFAREQTQPHAVFLTAPSILEPVLTLGGRAIVRGDTAWLWSHGYDFADREADVKLIYRGGDEALQLISYYSINYIYVGPREKEIGADQRFFESHFKSVFQSPKITIFEANPTPAAVPVFTAPRELAAREDNDPHQVFVEFQSTGYTICRLYKLAFGRWPKYEEFRRDMQMVGKGLFVGTPGWEAVAAQNRRDLVNDFVNRDGFKTAFDGIANGPYVATLQSHNPGSAEDERALVTSLNGGKQTRASLLLDLAARRTKADYNAAYVLVHYFGYFHRSPEDPPDNDLRGFNFWLDNLNRTGAYRDVTRAFLESQEYKQIGRKAE